MSESLRSFDLISLVLFTLSCLAWAGGGWLAARAWFALRPVERLMGGAAAGFVVYLTLINLLTPLVGLNAACGLSAGVILSTGLGAAWRARLTWADLRPDLASWPQFLVLGLITLFFWLMQQGVSLFDEFLHVPMVSIMGAGSIPPRFYLNPELNFAYHYGLQIFAALLTAQARFFPWSAWDATRALAIGLTAVLGWLWVRRGTGRGTAGTLGALAFVFGGGARWLLLLLPGSLLAWVNQGVQMSYSGAVTGNTLAQALYNPWLIEGAGNYPFPFAFVNGVYPPSFFVLGSTGMLPHLTLLLLLLLARPYPNLRRPGGLVVLGLILANLALSAEHLFAFLWLSIALAGGAAVLLAWRGHRPLPREQLAGWAVILALSAVLSIFQGGFITETLRDLWLRLQGQTAAVSNLYGFTLRWPPAIPTAHLGNLSPLVPAQLLALLAEFGPVILAAPLATFFAWRCVRRGDWLAAGMGFSALMMLLFTLFFEYGVDRSSTRFANSPPGIWLILAFPLLCWFYTRSNAWVKAALGTLYAILLVSGGVILAVLMINVNQPVPAYFINPLDVEMSRDYWNTLEPGAMVFDAAGERAVAVFGRFSKSNASIYLVLPEKEALIADPDPQKIAAAGYLYVYYDQNWYNGLPDVLKQAYRQPCVRLVAEKGKTERDRYRKLVDVRACR